MADAKRLGGNMAGGWQAKARAMSWWSAHGTLGKNQPAGAAVWPDGSKIHAHATVGLPWGSAATTVRYAAYYFNFRSDRIAGGKAGHLDPSASVSTSPLRRVRSQSP